jgi:tetratricopeptide (TPR) repeat protein
MPGKTYLFSALLFAAFISPAQQQARIDTLFRRAFRMETHCHERQLTLDSILSIDHRNAYAWQQKSMPLFKRKKYELGMTFLDSAVKYDNGYRWLEYRGFIKCFFQKSYRAAMADLATAEKLNPGGVVMDHSYDFHRGLCLLQLNRFDSARYFISRSIDAGLRRIGEGHFLEHFYLGIVFMEQGRYGDAETAFDLAIKGYRRFSDAKFHKALCARKLGRADEARSLLLEARADLLAGYTITEDNVIYEEYPYQVRLRWIDGQLR